MSGISMPDIRALSVTADVEADMQQDTIELAAAVFGAIAVVAGYLFMKKSDDTYVAMVCFIVAFVIFGWLYWG